jgi:cephalosporin hydroxylase
MLFFDSESSERRSGARQDWTAWAENNRADMRAKSIERKEMLQVWDTRVDIGLAGITRGHHNMQYRGVRCVKCPLDYVLYQMLLAELRPDLVIEIGTHQGGSALYLADLLQLLGGGEVHTIDIEDRLDSRVRENPNVRVFGGGWEAYDLNLAAAFKKVLVIEDSAHTYSNTLRVMNHFAPLVTPGSYMIVEDGIVDALGLSEQFGGGPVRAIQEFLGAHTSFEPDLRWSDFFGKNATFNPLGYLKRNH